MDKSIFTITQHCILAFVLMFVTSCGGPQPSEGASRGSQHPRITKETTISAKKDAATPYLVLSLDGGGIRGTILARILEDIEEKTGKRIYQLFDLVIGTSTGGLLGLLLTLPRATHDKLPMSAVEAGRFYFENREKIFLYSCKWYVPKLACSLNGPVYKSDGIEALIRQFYPNQLFSSTLIPVVLTTFDIEAREGMSLESDNPRFQQLSVLEAGRSTSAAPTYFTPIKVRLPDKEGKMSDTWLVDGGMYKNNPALLGYDRAEQLFGAQNINERGLILISIGTGVNSQNPHNGAALVDAGAATWGHAVVDAMMAGASNEDELTLQTIFSGLKNSAYIRIQTELDNKKYPSIADLDNTAAANIAKLLEATNKTLQSKDYQQALEILMKNRE